MLLTMNALLVRSIFTSIPFTIFRSSLRCVRMLKTFFKKIPFIGALHLHHSWPSGNIAFLTTIKAIILRHFKWNVLHLNFSFVLFSFVFRSLFYFSLCSLNANRSGQWIQAIVIFVAPLARNIQQTVYDCTKWIFNSWTKYSIKNWKSFTRKPYFNSQSK